MDLDSSVLTIPGVGPASAKALESHGLKTVHDVLLFTPYRYIDFTAKVPISSLQIGMRAVVSVEIDEVKSEFTSKRHMALVRARLRDASGQMHAVWFNQRFLLQTLKQGALVHLYGDVVFDAAGGKSLRNPTILYEKDPRPIPIYSEKSGIESGRFARIIQKIVHMTDQITDPLPAHLVLNNNLLSLPEALRHAHMPTRMSEVTRAVMRLSLDELWTIMTMMRLAKKVSAESNAYNIAFSERLLKEDQVLLPFKLTGSQKNALKDIIKDFEKKIPMRRLLNGDVGSGKTIVAYLAARQVLSQNLKVVMLLPTTVLASQQYESWRILFPDVKSFLFTSQVAYVGNEKMSRAKAIIELNATLDAFVCGTHAVLSEALGLNEGVGLVIVDEQHRFGVAQRAHLFNKAKGNIPHLLSMSATPIPRTAALVLYGDLDISLLPEKPIGRIPIITKLASEKSRELVYAFIDQLIAKGQQVFVVCPTIGLDPKEPVDTLFPIDERKAAVEEYERLKQSVFVHRRIGLLHGKLKLAEKEAVLDAFRAGEFDILISTTVIEVGVDIPNSCAMVVEGAEFFGLAQLHQLRGRVGRSGIQSYCFLFASRWTKDISYRLQLLVDHADGFALAEKDLELRGPGELYGTAQAGIEPFRYANLGDMNMVVMAQGIAHDILAMPRKRWPIALDKWINGHQKVIHGD